MKFESAGFKLTLEMVELMGSDGKTVTPLVEWFQQLVIRGFLAVREHRAEILAIVEPMLASTLVVSIRAARTHVHTTRRRESDSEYAAGRLKIMLTHCSSLYFLSSSVVLQS